MKLLRVWKAENIVYLALAQIVMTAQTVKAHLDTLNPSPIEAEEGEEAG